MSKHLDFIKSKINRYKFPIIILLLVALIFWHKNLFDFLTVENFAGLDLIGNYSYTWLMNRFIQNLSFNGWTNLWFAGSPTFDFYPPLFFVFTNLFNIVTFNLFSLKICFKIMVFGSLFLFPFLIYYSSRKMGLKKLESFFVSIFSFGFLFLVGHFAAYYETLNFGLVSQMFAIDIFVLLLGFIHDLDTNRKIILTGILLGFTILSHLFVGFIALISLFIILLLHYQNWKKYGYVLLIGILISGPWLFNAFYHSSWLQVYTSKPGSIWDFPMIFVPFMIAGIKLDRKRIILLGLLVINLIIGLFNLPLSFQHARYFQYALLFGFILTGLGAFRIYDFLSSNLSKGKFFNAAIISIILIPFLFTVINTPVYRQYRSDMNIDDLNSWIKDNVRSGRILTESDNSLNKDYYKLMETIPRKAGKNTLNGLHVDASLSSPYTLALQYWLSSNPDINPICDICKEHHDINKNILLERLQTFNVKYVISSTDSTEKYLDSFLNKVQKENGFSILEVPGQDKYYEVLDYKPPLIVSSLEDWKELNRKLFTSPGIGNVTFVWSREKPKNIDKFSNIFIKDPGENIEEFYSRIRNNYTLKKIKGSDIKGLDINGEKIKIKMKSKKPIPLLLKFSYNPKWKVVGDGEKYLSNYGLSLIYTKGGTFLRYSN